MKYNNNLSLTENAINGVDITVSDKPTIEIIELSTENLIKTVVDIEGTAKPETEEHCGSYFIGFKVMISDGEDIHAEYFFAGAHKDYDDLLDEIVAAYPEDEYNYSNWTE